MSHSILSGPGYYSPGFRSPGYCYAYLYPVFLCLYFIFFRLLALQGSLHGFYFRLLPSHLCQQGLSVCLHFIEPLLFLVLLLLQLVEPGLLPVLRCLPVVFYCLYPVFFGLCPIFFRLLCFFDGSPLRGGPSTSLPFS